MHLTTMQKCFKHAFQQILASKFKRSKHQTASSSSKYTQFTHTNTHTVPKNASWFRRQVSATAHMRCLFCVGFVLNGPGRAMKHTMLILVWWPCLFVAGLPDFCGSNDADSHCTTANGCVRVFICEIQSKIKEQNVNKRVWPGLAITETSRQATIYDQQLTWSGFSVAAICCPSHWHYYSVAPRTSYTGCCLFGFAKTTEFIGFGGNPKFKSNM